MKPQYTKPQARDLGGYRSMLASGQWDGPPMPGMPGMSGGPGGESMLSCFDGTTANTIPGQGTNCENGASALPANCVNGSIASGAGCGPGTAPGTQDCEAGGAAAYFACQNGTRAAGGVSCSTGTQPS